MEKLRIAIVDDHPAVRDGIKRYVAEWPHGEVVLEANDGVEYEELCQGQPAPDMVLVDLNMPRRDGWETLAWIAREQPATKAIAFTFDPNQDAVHRALAAKAGGVLSKTAERLEWLTALEHVRLTGHYHNALKEQALLHTPDPGSPAALRKKAMGGLSPSQLAFALKYTSDAEHTIKRVGEEMGVEESTAETYRKQVKERTGAATRLAIYKFLLRFHIIQRP